MSLLLNQPWKICHGKPVLVRSSPVGSNGFSSSLPQTPPCCIIKVESWESCSGGDLVIKNVNERSFTNVKKMVPLELGDPSTHFRFGKLGTIGSSHGWVASVKDRRVRLQDDLNPAASSTDPKCISLPHLVTLPYCQTQIVTNVAMSSSNPEAKNCVVAIKFLGPQLSLCRPAESSYCDSEWTNIKITNPCFSSSRVMYSKRDDMFHIPGGHLIGSWDLRRYKDHPKIQRLRFHNLPELTMAKRETLHSCSVSEHLVESPTSGEIFLVKWYKKTTGTWLGMPWFGTPKMKTEALMVFKVDEEGNAVYTEDIGDVVIFLSRAEPFCVPASSFPGMFPNTVEIIDVDEIGTVNLAQGTVSTENCTFLAPYYIPPQNIEH